MASLSTFVLETCNAPGTGATVTLGGAAAGRVAFATAFTSGATVFYFMDDGTQAEWGYGIFTSGSPNTLTRGTTLGNTAGTTAKLNFAGSTRIYNEVPASSMLYVDPLTGNVIVPSTAKLTGALAATAAADVPNLGQIAWVASAEQSTTVSIASMIFPLPTTGPNFVGLEWADIVAATTTGGLVGIPQAQFSFDGGVTYSTNCGYVPSPGGTYATSSTLILGNSAGSGRNFGSALQRGSIARGFIVDSATLSGTGLTRYAGATYDATSVGSSATHIKFLLSSSNIGYGTVRLLTGS